MTWSALLSAFLEDVLATLFAATISRVFVPAALDFALAMAMPTMSPGQPARRTGKSPSGRAVGYPHGLSPPDPAYLFATVLMSRDCGHLDSPDYPSHWRASPVRRHSLNL